MEELDWSRMLGTVAMPVGQLRLQHERERNMRAYEDAILKYDAACKSGDPTELYEAGRHLRRVKKGLRLDDRRHIEHKLSFL